MSAPTIHDISVVVFSTELLIPPYTITPVYAEVESATLSEDETWSPFVQFSCVISLLKAEPTFYYSPLLGNTIDITVTKTWADGSHAPQTRTWTLGIRTVDYDYKAGTVTLTAESAEGRLQDYGRPEANVSTAATASVAAVATAVVAKIPGATLDTSGYTASAIAETLRWEPGMKAWDYARGAIEKGGKRLFSRTGLAFFLVDTPYTVAGTIALDSTDQVKTIRDTYSRDGDAWADCVVVVYRWTDGAGVSQVRYDSANSVGGVANVTKTLTITRTDAYPGAGAAQAILDKVTLRGRKLVISAISNYDAMPGKAATITLPTGATVNKVIRAVEYRFPDNTMNITTRET